jgi:hypothetical protein
MAIKSKVLQHMNSIRRTEVSMVVVLLLLFMQTALFAESKIVYLISPPRSGSVAFLRMMEARHDFAIFHEPSQWVFNSKYYPDLTRDWFLPEAPAHFDEVKAQILAAARTGNVFVKEMSFAVRDSLLEDEELFLKPNVHFVFLLRNPHHVTISFCKKWGGVFDGLSSLLGYSACYEIFQKAKKSASNPPIILFTEELVASPNKVLEQFFTKLDLPFLEESLSWQDLGNDFTGTAEWHEIKTKNDAQHWHKEAIHSSGFGSLPHYKVDSNGEATFEEIENREDREVCKKVYQDNLIFYQLLQNEAQL